MKSYPGNKNIDGVYHKIINEIPKCEVFRELFAGSAAIAAHVATSGAKIVLNYKSAEAYSFLTDAFPGAIVTNDCAISLIKQFPEKPNRPEVTFLDPPYRHGTRPNNTELYTHEMTDDDHVQLLSAILEKEQHHQFMIQHPDDELYNEKLSHWRKVEMTIRYHQKTSKEILYMNYQRPLQLQLYNFLGKDFGERQRIKRKGDRHVARLLKLPDLERNYILQRLKELG